MKLSIFIVVAIAILLLWNDGSCSGFLVSKENVEYLNAKGRFTERVAERLKKSSFVVEDKGKNIRGIKNRKKTILLVKNDIDNVVVYVFVRVGGSGEIVTVGYFIDSENFTNREEVSRAETEAIDLKEFFMLLKQKGHKIIH